MKYVLTMIAVTLYSLWAPVAAAWETVEDMNKQIDQTNFIVGDGCSGTLISIEKRLIVTAHHCVSGKIRQVTREVIGPDGKVEKKQFQRLDNVTVSQRDYSGYTKVGALEYVTKIVAYRQERDLALLQLVGANLRSTVAAPVLSASEPVQRGETVVAVGNPRMLDASVTQGIVSSVTRAFPVPWALNEPVNFIQFDASIAPGSSGGALFNSRGQYIGTTVATFPGADLALAIPVQDLHDLLSDNCFASVYDSEADDEACEKKEQATPVSTGDGAEPLCETVGEPGFAPLCRQD